MRYTGKHAPSRGASPRFGRMGLALVIMAALFAALTGAVVAYLSSTTGAVSNNFSEAQSGKPVILENFSGSEKTNVRVDTGELGYAVYVRAAVVVTWKNGENGSVYGEMPVAGTDYNISYGNDWTYNTADGFWYYNSDVKNGEDTTALIDSCTPVEGEAPAGYDLNVEIITQTVQALGSTDDGSKTAVTDAWGVTMPVGNGG